MVVGAKNVTLGYLSLYALPRSTIAYHRADVRLFIGSVDVVELQHAGIPRVRVATVCAAARYLDGTNPIAQVVNARTFLGCIATGVVAVDLMPVSLAV
jgi:hypothetical protein